MDRPRVTVPVTPALALLLALVAACGRGPAAPAAAAPGGLGTRVAAGEPRAFAASADGAWLAWLDGCRIARGQWLPPGTANCDVRVAPAAGGDARRVAGAVTTLPQGLAWSPTGAALAILADYDYAAGSGTLVLWRDGAARELAREVTFSGFGAHGELGFVAAGRLSVLLPGEAAPRAVEGTDGVATFDLSAAAFPDCGARDVPRVRLAARRKAEAGGQLLVSDCGLGPARPIGPQRAGEYGFSATGTHLAWASEGKGSSQVRLVRVAGGAADWTVGTGGRDFAFAPDGRTLAFVADVAPGKEGNLYLAEPGGKPALVARDVGDYRWARGAPRLAWLERYDPRVRSGVVGAGGPGTPPRTFGRNVTDIDISSDGRFVAYLQHTTRGGYSVDLGLAALDGAAGAAPAVVAQGVFGFAFSPDGRWLYYRTRCTRNGEGCDLERIPAGGLPKDGKPEPIAQGMKSFEFDPRDPSRVLVGWQRVDRPALDVGVWAGGRLLRVDQVVLPGSARFLGPDSARLAYAVTDPKRAGVYVAALPR